MKISENIKDTIELLALENDHLKCVVAPALGGKIISVYNKSLQKEFLWRNENLPLSVLGPGADYDSNFFGGIDELIPNDIPENIDGIDYPDHGELWTTPLSYKIEHDKIILSGLLQLSGLFYQKKISLAPAISSILLEYKIRNDSSSARHFLWKLHAALVIEKGDELSTAAAKGKVVDAAYSRFTDTAEFDWPVIEHTNAAIIPGKTNTMDFFYLYGNDVTEMKLLSKNKNHVFSYRYDKTIFPYQWYFASYGGFLDHYTAILEPCTSMPISVNEAKQLNQCSVLQPGEELNTAVNIFAGDSKTYISS